MRPPTHTPEATAHDVMRLSRVLRRVQLSERSEDQKAKLTRLISETISLLTSTESEGKAAPARKRKAKE